MPPYRSTKPAPWGGAPSTREPTRGEQEGTLRLTPLSEVRLLDSLLHAAWRALALGVATW